ncbi:MAG: hypothetical protein NXI12_08060 [Alphaproteobacteria bacterium]|nr:hypothetical protein [Alphaproteobacteria bacterium]
MANTQTITIDAGIEIGIEVVINDRPTAINELYLAAPLHLSADLLAHVYVDEDANCEWNAVQAIFELMSADLHGDRQVEIYLHAFDVDQQMLKPKSSS